MKKKYLFRVLSLGGILAPPTMITFILVAGFLTPGYSHITDSVSQLSDQASQHPGVMTVGFFSYGVLIVGFAYALHMRLHHGVKATIAWFGLTLYGICMIMAGIFQDTAGDVNASLNTEGFIHNAVIITSNLSILIGMWMFAGSVYRKPSWFGFTWFTIGATFVGLVLSIVFALQSYVVASGLLQRLFYLVLLIWVETVSVWLFRQSFTTGERLFIRE